MPRLKANQPDKYEERMAKAIETLEAAAAEMPAGVEFNMSHWWLRNPRWPDDCGTVCCAAGLLALNPWFSRRGLRLGPPQIDITGDQLRIIEYRDPKTGRTGSAFFALDEFFGESTMSVFDQHAYSKRGPETTPANVAARLKLVLAEYREKRLLRETREEAARKDELGNLIPLPLERP